MIQKKVARGAGLSAVIWKEYACQVIGLEGGTADLVTAMDSLHWKEFS